MQTPASYKATRAVYLTTMGIALLSSPFDFLFSPRWMLYEDLITVALCLFFWVQERQGRSYLARVGLILYVNSLVLFNCRLLGPDGDWPSLLILFTQLPFLLFDFTKKELSRFWFKAMVVSLILIPVGIHIVIYYSIFPHFFGAALPTANHVYSHVVCLVVGVFFAVLGRWTAWTATQARTPRFTTTPTSPQTQETIWAEPGSHVPFNSDPFHVPGPNLDQ